VKEKLRRLEHRLDDDASTFEESARTSRLGRKQLVVAARFDVSQRTPKRLLAERTHKLIPALRITR
jgi:hypothetical protein